MTDFYSVLQRAVSSLPDGSGPQRRAVYDKARKALLKQLQSFDPPLPSSEVTSQRLALEDAIRKIENEIARQIRTRRAVQGAMGAPRAAPGEPEAPVAAAAPQGPPPEAHPGVADRRGRDGPERDRDREAEALESAVSAAAVDAALEPVPAPADEEPPQPLGGIPGEPYEDGAPEIGPDEREDEAAAFAAEVPGYEDERSAAEAEAEAEALEAEREAMEADFGDETTPEPAAVRRRRRDGERRPRGGRSDPREQSRALVPAGRRSGGRSMLARVALPLIVLALLVGASYAAFTQRTTLLAMIDEFGTKPAPVQREPITVASRGVEKSSDRLPALREGENTRTVTTTTVRTTPPPAGDDPAEPAATVPEASPFAGDLPATEAEQQLAVASPTAETPPSAAEPAPPAPADEPIGEITAGGSQQAVLYEEALRAGEQGSALEGEVEWSMVRQSVGGGEPEPVVRADATIPERNLNATITIRENRDDALPASHLIEIEIEQTGGEEGAGVKSVPGIIMKETEQSRGEALRGAAARVSSGLFWVALSENEADQAMNLRLLRERDWIDIPILYESGRRAILTLRKGNDGFQSVNAAIKEWSPG